MVYEYCIDRLVNDAETAEAMAVKNDNPKFNAMALYYKACIILKQKGIAEENPVVREGEKAYEAVLSQTSSGSEERFRGLVSATALLLKIYS